MSTNKRNDCRIIFPFKVEQVVKKEKEKNPETLKKENRKRQSDLHRRRLCLTYASTFLSPGHKARIRLTIYHCLFRIGKKICCMRSEKNMLQKRTEPDWCDWLWGLGIIYRWWLRSWNVMSELSLVKVLLLFIGRSDSNHSAFYLYKATSTGNSGTLYYVYVQASKGCGLCTA